MDWEFIIVKVIGCWLIAGLLAGAYHVSKFSVQSSLRHSYTPASLSVKLKSYGIGQVTVAIFSALFLEDSGTAFFVVFLTLIPPVFFGIQRAFQIDKHISKPDREKLNAELHRNAIEAEKNDDQ